MSEDTGSLLRRVDGPFDVVDGFRDRQHVL
jgi:hypothetical protein